MTWKRYFTPVTTGERSPLSASGRINPTRTNYSSYLPDVYSGHPNRLERYAQYDTMDMDPEVNAAFDILAEFCTQVNDENGTPFRVFFKEQATPTEVKIIKKYMQQWSKLNKFGTRIFKIVRNTFKYGDCFFIRDPENQAWFYIDPSKIDKIIVNESDGKKPEQYVIRDININFQNLTVTQINPTNQNSTPGGTAYVTGGAQQRGMVGAYPQATGSRFTQNQNQWAIDAKHVVHLSLSEGLDNNFPFGNSLMETIFKVYKQKELLEDAIIIYRVQRAPERRVFYIDVGNMPSHLAMSFVERVKNEVNQRRIPSVTGGGQSVIDSSYNPLGINEDYFFPQTSEGRGSKVEILPGGTNLGEISDLLFFTQKLMRALRIPSSYLPTGDSDSQTQFTDGRVGTAYIQELRFNNYCERLQSLINEQFDTEFKQYLFNKGMNIDPNLFDLKFNPPQNFAAHRQAEMDQARVSTYSSVAEIPFLSKRFSLKRFLGLTAEEIAENEQLWREENGETDSNLSAQAEMRSAGVTSAGLSSDMSALGQSDTGSESLQTGENPDLGASPVGSAPGAGPGAGAPPAPPA
jgi:Bacteriophage T4-like portal protein (Gp20)